MKKKTYIAPEARWVELDAEELMDIGFTSEGNVEGTVDEGEYNGEFGTNRYSVWSDDSDEESSLSI